MNASIDNLIRVEQVAESEFYVGDLFRRSFGGDPPDYPRHFVAFYKAARNAYVAIGYIHFTIIDDLCLCGGMVADGHAVRRMPAMHQTMVRNGGGIAAKLFRDTFDRFATMPAIWAHVGDITVRDIFKDAGFAPTEDPYVMAKWNSTFAATEQAAYVARVRALGPF